MKVVALVSGGKDSCYAMMECVRYGHEIVALAHLHPSLDLPAEASEIDSFMYQSVGHNVVKLIAQSMTLPLVTEPITGKAIATAIDYHQTTAGDEVEDLYRLLEKVLLQFPEVEGVCTGAIFSSYQRNRVENVCSRLGLTSIGYLWRRDQEELLEEMIESGIKAILVKVASIGLVPRRHLGKTIGDLQQELLMLQGKYQLNVCGEGGEYETFTLDCPLFKKRIVIDSSHIVLHSDDYVSPVAFMVIDACHLEDKEPSSPSKLASKIPPQAVPPFTIESNGDQQHEQFPVTTLTQLPAAKESFFPLYGRFRNQVHVSGIKSANSASLTLEEEMDEIFTHVKDCLVKEGMTLEDVCFVHLYVQDMRAFGQINAAYCQYFGQHMPPSRSCVEVAAIPGRVLMDCFAIRGSGINKLLATRVMRDVLHVKSISAWAPNCIGPYSQANILHRSLILLAGQIALFPQTMTVIGADHSAQLKQSFQNAGRVLEALDSNLRHCCSTIVYITMSKSIGAASMRELLQGSRTQLMTNGGLGDRFENVEDSDESDEEVDKDETRVALVSNVPILVVQVSHLPRDALVEVEIQAFTHRVVKYLQPVSSSFLLETESVRYECQQTIIPRAVCLIVCTAKSEAQATMTPVGQIALGLLKCVETSLSSAILPWDRVIHIRVFYNSSVLYNELDIASAFQEVFNKINPALPLCGLTFVPVEAIQDGAALAIQVMAQDLDKLETELWLRKQI